MDIAGLGVVTTGTAKEAWDSIQKEWGQSTDMQRSHAQEALNQTLYVEDTDIQEHLKILQTRKAAMDSLSTSAMTSETWKGIVIHSIPPTMKWLPVIPSLYVMMSTTDIFSALIAHGMILDRGTRNKPTSGSSNTALAAKVTADGCANPNCKAKKRSTHTTADCYWPGGGKEGQFPPNFGQRSWANLVSSSGEMIEHFVLSAQVPDTPEHSEVIVRDNGHEIADIVALVGRGFKSFGEDIPTFIDSGASDTMFVSREDFSKYTSITP